MARGLDDAWNRSDGSAWASYYAEGGEFINILGTVFEGREAIGTHHADGSDSVAGKSGALRGVHIVPGVALSSHEIRKRGRYPPPAEPANDR